MNTSPLCAVTGPPDAAPTPLAQVLAYIEHNACQPLRLEHLASIACLSVCRFIRVFHRQFGLPPHRYICHVRIERAKVLLRAGVAPAVVAGETGFYDQSHLSRHFKNLCGVTPGQYLSQLNQYDAGKPQTLAGSREVQNVGCAKEGEDDNGRGYDAWRAHHGDLKVEYPDFNVSSQ